jgi:hypothetical protein
MAVNLLSYTGTPELGVGAGTAPVGPTNPNLEVVNNTLRDIMLLDNQRNVMLFQQKVKDRDALTEMIMKNQVSSGDILPEYRQHFDKAEQQAEKAFQDWGGNLNDKDGYRKYQSAIQDLRDISAHAQGKTMSLRALEKEKSQQILPRKQADYQKWIEQEKTKPFWDAVTPYQQLHDFSVDDILAGVKPFSTVTRDAKDPTISYDTTYFDYNDILRNKKNQYINDRDAAVSIDQFFDKFQRLAPNQLVPTLDAMDAQIDRYNQERGFNQGDKGYVEKVKRADVNGQVLINEPKTEFAAKYALSQQPQYLTRTPKFDKDIAKYGIDKAKLNLQAKKLGIDAAKAGAYIRNLNAKTDKFVKDQQDTGTNIVKQYEDFVNGVAPLNTIDKKTGNAIERLNAVFVDRLPQSYRFIGGPVMAVDSKGKPTGKVTVGQLEPFISTDASKRPYYLTRYVNPSTGEQLDPNSNFVNETYNTWRGSGYRGSKEDMVKTLLKQGALEMILQGKNGAANYTSMYQSAKTLNAMGTTKGEENIVNPPTVAPLPVDQEPE